MGMSIWSTKVTTTIYSKCPCCKIPRTNFTKSNSYQERVWVCLRRSKPHGDVYMRGERAVISTGLAQKEFPADSASDILVFCCFNLKNYKETVPAWNVNYGILASLHTWVKSWSDVLLLWTITFVLVLKGWQKQKNGAPFGICCLKQLLCIVLWWGRPCERWIRSRLEICQMLWNHFLPRLQKDVGAYGTLAEKSSGLNFF